jgi:LPS export ABC transporter protein LptC/lipopolysaccharide transport protein LptA
MLKWVAQGEELPMSRYAGYFLAVLVFVLVVQFAVLAPQNVNELRHEETTGPAQAVQTPADVEHDVRGAHAIETREGKRDWEMWSESAMTYKSRSQWVLNEVRIKLFGENGVDFTVTGKEGEIERETKNFKVSGHVVTRSSNGYQFMTETVEYNSQTRFLQSPGEVEMMGPRDPNGSRLNLKGEGLSADLSSSLIEIKRAVRAQRRFPPDRFLVIRSDGAQFSGQKRLARFIGNVVMDMDDMRITGPEAEFEYDPKKELVKSISVKGGVKASDTQKWATAQNLKVQFEDDKYIFRGNPRVVQDTDELRGEEIVFLDGGKRVQVQRARAKVDEKTMEKVR